MKNLREDFTEACARESRLVLYLEIRGFSAELNEIAALKGAAEVDYVISQCNLISG